MKNQHPFQTKTGRKIIEHIFHYFPKQKNYRIIKVHF